MNLNEIPVIDIAPFRNNSAGTNDVCVQISRACEEIGFFIITGHGVPLATIDTLNDEAGRFFDRPTLDKSAIAKSGSHFGGPTYAPINSETLAATLGGKGIVDFKECLDAGPRFQGDHWPDDCNDLKTAWNAAFVVYDNLAAILRKIFARSMGLSDDGLEQAFSKHCSSLRTLNYPEITRALEPGQERAGIHTDYGAFTILRGDNVPGLQVQQRDGSWIDAPAIADSFIINIGDALMRWTNDYWKSTPHRVVSIADDKISPRRQSIAYFHNPGADAVIECLAPFLPKSGIASYPPVTYQDYAEKKYQQSRGSNASLLLDARE